MDIISNPNKHGKYTAKVHYENGDHVVTDVYGSPKTITNYFFDKVFNIGDGGNGDLLTRCVKIEFLGRA